MNDGELSVDRVRVGTVLRKTTRCATAPPECLWRLLSPERRPVLGSLGLGSAELVSKDVHYKTYGLTSLVAAPRFQDVHGHCVRSRPCTHRRSNAGDVAERGHLGVPATGTDPPGHHRSQRQPVARRPRAARGIDISLSNSTRPIP